MGIFFNCRGDETRIKVSLFVTNLVDVNAKEEILKYIRIK